MEIPERDFHPNLWPEARRGFKLLPRLRLGGIPRRLGRLGRPPHGLHDFNSDGPPSPFRRAREGRARPGSTGPGPGRRRWRAGHGRRRDMRMRRVPRSWIQSLCDCESSCEPDSPEYLVTRQPRGGVLGHDRVAE
jgi:hypothetical protein